MMDRIDLSTVPSAMEATAAQWRGNGNGTGKAMKPLPPRPEHLRFSKPPMPKFKPESIKPYKRQDDTFTRGNQTRPSQDREAELDAIRHQDELRKLIAPAEPDPARYAHTLSLAVANDLIFAQRCTGSEIVGLWQVPPTRFESEMMRLGLIGLMGKHRRILTKLGRAVRAELLKDEG